MSASDRQKQGTRYKFRSFHETRSLVHKLGLASRREWRLYCAGPQRPLDIPTNPQVAYRSEFKGWGDFLGSARVAGRSFS